MSRLPVHIEVKPHPGSRREKEENPEATDVFVSGNGYQWAGFTLKHGDDLERLRDALTVHLREMGRE